jgi:hypothetical protein
MIEHGMNGRLSEEGFKSMHLVPAEWHCHIDEVERHIDPVEIGGVKQ